MLVVLLPMPLLAAPASLCPKSQTTLFACAIGPQQLAVCAGSAEPVLRLGRKLRTTTVAQEPRSATRGFSGGGETTVAFRKGNRVYTLYDRTVRTEFGADGRNAPDSVTGLAITRDGVPMIDGACAFASIAGSVDAVAAALAPSAPVVPR